jgi:hypothetical protein
MFFDLANSKQTCTPDSVLPSSVSIRLVAQALAVCSLPGITRPCSHRCDEIVLSSIGFTVVAWQQRKTYQQLVQPTRLASSYTLA